MLTAGILPQKRDSSSNCFDWRMKEISILCSLKFTLCPVPGFFRPNTEHFEGTHVWLSGSVHTIPERAAPFRHLPLGPPIPNQQSQHAASQSTSRHLGPGQHEWREGHHVRSCHLSSSMHMHFVIFFERSFFF